MCRLITYNFIFAGERGDLPLSAALHTPYNSICSSSWHSQTECHSPIFPSTSLPHRYPTRHVHEDHVHRKRQRVEEEASTNQLQQHWTSNQFNHQQQKYFHIGNYGLSQAETIPQYNGTTLGTSQEINNNNNYQRNMYTTNTEGAVVPRQARAAPRQYLMQVNGVQVTPLPSPTTLVFQGHFTAIEAESPAFMLRSNQIESHLCNGNASNNIPVRRRMQVEPNLSETTTSASDNLIRTQPNTKTLVQKNSYSNKGIRYQNIANSRRSQSQLVKQTILNNPEYNPSCMYSQASPSKPDIKSVTDICDMSQFWKIKQGNCMDIIGAEKATSKNNNNIGKLGLACIPQGNDLPNIGSFLEYLEEI